ncbi:SDR family NAD(P)-dependent oxidoreductase [Pigmentiphaga sp. CHJ604]|uniref:SDR family NAD(P)-dependent oxidoreductase n=1 Tax=Pigmentiphaga sp. CHJ604 TaxID=3081984 RepID=UPI0030D36319
MNDLRDFEGKTAFVTAGGSGIGRCIALEAAARGATVLVSDRSGQLAEQVAADIRQAGGKARALELDVRDTQRLLDAVDAAAEPANGLDLLFNVAGINIPKNVEHMDEDEWSAVMDVNLNSVYRACRQAIPHMRRRGGGAIINIASIAGIMAENRCGAYSASKGGVVLLTRNMAMDFARDNIRVNAVCPGSTRTPRTQSYWRSSPTGKSEMAELCPMKRSAEPEEIARPAVFLASDGASYITGAALVVDGGMTAGFRIPTFDRM